MAISFTLDLTPNQIEFLQQLDLYADGVIPHVPPGAFQHHFITWVRKLIREGLAEHLVPEPGRTRYEHQIGGGEVIRAYRITPKGRAVLDLIRQDVEAFMSRQRAYQDAKTNGKKKRA